jgi:Dolichyl-phosphate-mannose-protein mannosyltransferase
MTELIRQHRRLFVAVLLGAVALRLLFIFRFPVADGDTLLYGDIAKNWLYSHVFGTTVNGAPEPTLIRLPGYPAFLALCFVLFGRDHYNAVRLAQLVVDVVTCFLVADIARRISGRRAAIVAFVIAALCPFTANYVALPLAETLSIFFTALAFWFAVRALDSGRVREWAWCGLAISAGIYQRPDGVLVLGAIGLWLVARIVRQPMPRDRQAFKSEISNQKSAIGVALVLLGIFALAPLIPWTLRNWRVFHIVQPLAARYANNPDEDPHLGFQRWVKTWMAEYVSVVEVYWHEGGEAIDPNLLPSRAFDSAQERQETFDVFAAYNQTLELAPALDEELDQIAARRARRHPLRQYLWLPAARIADMWFRPRTEMLGVMERWWEYKKDRRDFAKALAFAMLNLAYVGAAVWGMLRARKVRYAGLLITFVVIRSLFLGTLENPEPRYTLEMFPVVFAFAAAALAGAQRERPQSA